MDSETDILLRFGNRVRELRASLGLSQEAFADHCALDRTYIGGIERGERNISLKNIAVISEALEMSVSDLVKGI